MNFIKNLYYLSQNKQHIIFTNKQNLYEYLKHYNSHLPYPENFDWMDINEIYKFLQQHNVNDEFALFNIKVLNDYRNNICIDYSVSCFIQINELIKKFEKVTNLKFTTIDVDYSLNELYNNFNNLNFNDCKYSTHDTISNIEWMVLFYLSLFIQLMIDGRKQQMDIYSRKNNNIICLNPKDMLNTPITKFQNIVEKHFSNNNYLNMYKNLLNSFNNIIKNNFDILDVKNQRYVYICKLLVHKIQYAIIQKRNRTFMLNVSDELLQINDYSLINDIKNIHY